jgi:hypothetical protein
LLRITDSEIREGNFCRISPDLLSSWRVSTIFQFQCFSFFSLFSNAATALASSPAALSCAAVGITVARKTVASPSQDVIIGTFRLLRIPPRKKVFSSIAVT